MKHRRSVPKEERVELVGVPHYSQGEADELCGYYTMSMMLAALFPELSSTIHDTPRQSWKGSPVFQALRRLYTTEKRFKQKIADWFFSGIPLSEATDVLNRFAQQRDPSAAIHFLRWPARARRIARRKRFISEKAIAQVMTVNDVLYALSMHLPVIVARGGLGAHAVLAVGYQTRGASDRRILIHDPGSVRPVWNATGDLFVDDAEIIMPNLLLFQGYRPAKVVTGDGKSQFEQWNPKRVPEAPATI